MTYIDFIIRCNSSTMTLKDWELLEKMPRKVTDLIK